MTTPSESSGADPARFASSPYRELSLWEIFAVLVRGRRVVMGSALLFGFLAVLVGLILPRQWVVEASFRPQGAEASLGQISSIASQLGVNIPGQGKGDTPEFYTELIESRALLSRVTQRSFVISSDSMSSLENLLEIDDPDSAIREAEVIKWLRESAVSTSVGTKTGIVTVRVRTEWPHLSSQLAESVLEELNRFNSETRRSQAAAERGFVAERLEAARADLVKAELSQKDFLQDNRSWQNSPELRFEHDRLQREVLMRQQLYTSLTEAYEQARISEVRTTPVITILQEPYVPPLPERRGLILKLVLGLLLGGTVGFVYAFITRFGVPGRPEDRQAYDEVRSFFISVRRGRVREVVWGGSDQSTGSK